jgi:hypothetical protein
MAQPAQQAVQAQAQAQAQVGQPFALAPALLDQANPWDYSTREGQNIYKAATAPLPYLFEGRKSSLPAYLLAIRDRADQFGWHDILEITIGQDANNNNINRSLLTHYGEITLTQVRADADYIGTPSRNAQMSHQLYQCLQSSNNKEVADRMVTESENYIIDGTADGPAYLMTLIQTYFVHTEAKPTQLRLKISDAHLLIAEKEYNIDEFNTQINSYVNQLSALGTTTQDLFAHLTKAYKLVPDKHFQTYMSNKIDAHDDGTARLTSNQLMEIAKAKYDDMVETNTWMLQDEQDKQLVALTAQLEQVELNNKDLKSKLAKRSKNRRQSNQSNNEKWKWKEVPPKSGQTTKTFEGKVYNWCTYHKKWTIHKPADCRLKDKQIPPKEKKPQKKEQARYQVIFDDDWNDPEESDVEAS